MDWASEQLHVTQFPKFLARRNMIITIVGIIMFSGASFWLENLQAFKILFLIGLISRLISLFLQLYLFKKFPSTNSNLHHIDHSEQKPEFNSEMASIVKRILLPLTLFRFGVNIASPFFLPFMTHEIKLSTATYALLSTVPLMARLFFLQNWARSGTGLRPFWGIQFTSLGISILPGLWALWWDVPYLIIYQLLSGLFWSGMELCSTLMVQNLARGQARVIQGRMLAMNTGFTLLGTLVGGILLEQHFSYQFVFTLSTVLRIISAIWLYLFIARYPRLALNKKTVGPYLSVVLSIRPTLANTARFILGARPRRSRT
jgi:MFS family permease